MTTKTEELEERIIRLLEILSEYSASDEGRAIRGFRENSRNGIASQILQAFNQWLEEHKASGMVKCPDCVWWQFEGVSVGMTPCHSCNSTGYILEPLRLEVKDDKPTSD